MGQTSSCLICFYLGKVLSYNKCSVWSKIQNIWPLHGSQMISRDYSVSKHWDTVPLSIRYVLFAIWTGCSITIVLLFFDLSCIKQVATLINLLWLSFSPRDSGNSPVGVNDRLWEGGNYKDKHNDLKTLLMHKRKYCIRLSIWSNRLIYQAFFLITGAIKQWKENVFLSLNSSLPFWHHSWKFICTIVNQALTLQRHIYVLSCTPVEQHHFPQ